MEKIEWLVPAVLVLNVVLSAASKVFEVLGKSEKMPAWVNSLARLAQRATDILGSNRQH